MSKEKLLEARKKVADSKAKERQQLVDAQIEVKNAVVALGEVISGQAFDWDKFKEHMDTLKNSITFKDDVEKLENSLNAIHKDALKSESIENLIQAVKDNDGSEVVAAVNAVRAALESNTVSQSPEDFQPVRRVRKIGQRLVFDDDAMQVNVAGGGGGGGGIQRSLIEDSRVKVTTQEVTLIERYDYSDPNVIYVGSAPIGSAVSSPVWTITKYDLATASDGSGLVATNATWEDRETENYA